MKPIPSSLLAAGFLFAGAISHAQEAPADAVTTEPAAAAGGGASSSDLAKQTQNPVANLISVPFQNNFLFGHVDSDDFGWNLNIQPIVPVELSSDLLLINRLIVPVNVNPSSLGGAGGLGDTQYQGFFSPVTGKDITWGVGPIIGFPTATDSTLGAQRWTAGPAFVALVTTGPWVIGSTINHQWDWGGSGDRSVNLTFIQPFVNYNLDDGWYVVTAPAMTANWENGDPEWTVPLGGGIGKVVKFGGQPVNIQAQAFYNVARPENAPDWSVRLQVQLLFPK